MDEQLVQFVRSRALARCEYCRIAIALDEAPAQIDHIIPRKHGGGDEASNLALSCFSCNVHKGPNLSGLDPQSLKLTRLFNPRKDRWSRHFNERDGVILAHTAIGRTTIVVLKMNVDNRVALRWQLAQQAIYNHKTDP